MNTVKRGQLVRLLDAEAFVTAAERIQAGEDPRTVLADYRPFVARYKDDASRRAIGIFRDVAAGRIEVT